MASSIRVACGQLCSSSNLQNNARVVKKLIERAVAEQVKVLFLPEATDYISKDAAESKTLAQKSHEQFISVVQQEIRQINASKGGTSKNGGGLQVAIGVHEPSPSAVSAPSAALQLTVLTSFEPANPKSDKTNPKLPKVQNNQLWIDSSGTICHRYQKIHLFDIAIENGPILKESNSVEAGNSVVEPFPVDQDQFSNFRIGLATCYDIRFPELCLRLRSHGANILTYPSAFTTKTGESHWVALGRARAIDSQCYVVMAAQCGEHDTDGLKKRVSYGNSIIIDPWGTVVAQCPDYTGARAVDADGDYFDLCVADLDLNLIERVRRDMPLLDHRRPDVFED